MSWLYTIVFAGLALTSTGGAVPFSQDEAVKNTSVEVEYTALDETEKFEQIYPLSANGRVSVSNVNGSITVEAWDRNEVKLAYTKTADSKERLADVDIRIDAKPDYLSVETDYGDWKRDKNGKGWTNSGNLTVEYHLMVPRGAALNEIETVNGSVAVSNFTNFTKVSAVNGSVNASNIRGTAKLSTVNGEVAADFDRLETGSKISLETVNGKVNLVIPSDANATVKADSLNGNISNDFGLPVRKGKYVGRDLYGKLGSGDVQIRLNSVNGALSIGRKNDGKTPSPTVNLLPQKEKDDEDWDKDDDNDDDSSINSAKIDKDVAKAVKESAKVSVKVAKDAKVQINKIQPEIAQITAESVERAADAVEQTAQILQSDEFKQKMKDTELKQKEVMATIADASFFPSVPRVEKKAGSFPVKGVPQVVITAEGSAVVVRGWDKPIVEYNVTQRFDPRNRNAIPVNETHSDSGVTLEVENADPEVNNGYLLNGSPRVRIEVFVPRKTNLKISSNVEIRIDNVSGTVELTGTEGAINVRDSDGSLKVITSDGRTRVIGFRGAVDVSSSDGKIFLEGDFQKLKAHSGEGDIFLTLPENAQADLESNCDAVHGEGITLTKVSGDEDHSRYRIGNGGADLQIETAGEVHVRGENSLRSSF